MADFSIFQLHLFAIGTTVSIILFFNVLLGLKHYKNFSNALKLLVGYLVLSFLCESVSLVLGIRSDPNIWIINFYTIGEFFFIAAFILMLTRNVENKFIWQQIIIGSVLLGYILYFLLFKDIREFASLSETLENVLLMGLCFYYLMRSLGNKLNCYPQENKLVNWFVISLFVYLSGIVLLWLIYEFFAVDEYEDLTKVLVFFNAYLNLALKIATLIILLSHDYRVRRKMILG